MQAATCLYFFYQSDKWNLNGALCIKSSPSCPLQVYPGAWSQSWVDIVLGLTQLWQSKWISRAGCCLQWWPLIAWWCRRTHGGSVRPASSRLLDHHLPIWNAWTWKLREGPQATLSPACCGLLKWSHPLLCWHSINLNRSLKLNHHIHLRWTREAPTWWKWGKWHARPRSWMITQTTGRGSETGTGRSSLMFKTRETTSSHR